MPVILVGLGGFGVGIVRRVKRNILENPRLREEGIDRLIFFAGVDIQPDYDATIQAIEMVEQFEVQDPPVVVRENPDVETWWPGYEITAPLTGTTAGGQIRPAGRLAFYSNFGKVRDKVEETIEAAKSIALGIEDSTSIDKRLSIYIVSSLGGGTGSGMVIDVGFLIRSLIDTGDRVYAVLLDGSVTEKIGGPFTVINGFAALTEIERWMSRPGEFNMEYLGGKLSKSIFDSANKSMKLFEIIFLVQSDNIDGRTFAGSHDKVQGDYKDFAASFLELIAANRYFEATTYANNWNRFDQPKIYDGRSFNYASFAVSHISFPVEKVTNYCNYKYVCEDLAGGFNLDLTPPEDLEKRDELAERDGEQLTGKMHACDEYTKIKNRIDQAKDSLEAAKNPKEFDTTCSENDLVNFISWDKLFKDYEDKLRGELESKLRVSKESIEEKVTSAIGSLRFDDISSWLNEVGGILEKNGDHLDKTKKSLWSSKNENRQDLVSKANEVITGKKGWFGGKYKQKRNDFADKTWKDWHSSEIAYIEYPLMSDFYKNLSRVMNDLKWGIDFLKERFGNIAGNYQRQLGKYTSHKYLLDPERLEQRDYVLNMDVSVQRDVIDREIYSRARRKLDERRESVKGIIGAGIGEDVPGIRRIFRKIYDTYVSDPDNEAMLRSRAKEYETGIMRLMNVAVRDEIKQEVSGFGVDDAIEWFIDVCLKDLGDARGDNEKLNALRTRFELIFGYSDAGSLIEAQKDEDKWKRQAIRAIIKRMYQLTTPFVSLSIGKIRSLHRRAGFEENLAGSIEYRKVFASRNFRYKEMLGKVEIIETFDPHRISFYHQFGFFPLYCLQTIVSSYDVYSEHITSYRRQLEEGTPYFPPTHADKRFYDQWEDNIAKERPVTTETGQNVKLLFILGFGLDLIQRRRSLFYYVGEERKRIATTRGLLESVDKLRRETAFRREFAGLIGKLYEDKYIASNRSVVAIQEIFQAALGRLHGWQPSQDDPSRATWEELINLTRFDARNRPVGILIPKSEKEVDTQLQMIRGIM